MKFQAAAFLSSLPLFSLALLVPPFTESESSSPYLRSVAGSIGPDHVQIHFKTPCEGCFIGTEDGLEITLDIDRADFECTGTNLRLNGVPLRPSFKSSVTSTVGGQSTLSTRSSNGLGERDYHTEWNVFCLEGEASLLGVHLYQTDKRGAHHSVGGFSTSFRQTVRPWVLKLDPTSSTFGEEFPNQNEWIFPSREHRVEIVSSHLPPVPPSAISPGLREELEKLSKLKFEEEQLNKEIKDAETDIMKIWKAEFANCSTLKCYLRTAITDAPVFAKLIVKHFKHHDKIDTDFFKKSTHANCSGKEGAIKISQDQAPMDNDVEILGPEAIQAANFVPPSHSAPASPSTPEIPEEPVQPAEPSHPDHPHHPFHFGGPPRWVKDGELPPWGSGPPPWVKDGGRPPWGDGPPPWIKDGTPPPWARPGFHPPPWVHNGNQPGTFHPHNRPPFPFDHGLLSTSQQWKYRLIAAITSFVVVSFVAGLLFVCIKRRTKLFRDPRRRADCAARREERRRKKAYRKAACKHRFVTFVQRFRRSSAPAELEEKASLIHNKQQNEGSAFGHEIGNLRAAHDFVGDLVMAEEGRVQAEAAELEAGDSASVTETLPAYSAPPDYAVDVDGDISVVDGLQGIPRAASIRRQSRALSTAVRG